ncbi:MAG: cytochrome c [Chitinophagaceae bacterium]|nr:cytochrome c [Chitinophagaceae bacterium]
MKKAFIISGLVFFAAITGCSDVKRHPGRVYMPDMGNSVAYETYSSTDRLDTLGVKYTRMPVPGTIKRGELFPFPLAKDAGTDTTNYVLSKQVQNPLKSLTAGELKEAERLYLVNCGICHGTALDGNGPLYNGGSGPFGVAPRNLVSDPVVTNMPDGQMFYSITYGKGQMGPYGPQLDTKQRWMIVSYINSKQSGGSGAAKDSTAAPAKDSATAKK